MKYNFVYALALSAALLAFQARADIGAVGSPVMPSNPSKAEAQPTSNSWQNKNAPTDQNAATPAKEETSPLLVVTFNQRHVYFDRELREAVGTAEARQAGATYVVISTVPTDEGVGKSRVSHLNKAYAGNLDAVLKVMQDAGIPSGRIQVSTESSADVTAQEVSISIK